MASWRTKPTQECLLPPPCSKNQIWRQKTRPTSPQKGKHHLHPTPLSSLLNHPSPSLLEHQLVQCLVRSFDLVKKQLVDRFEPTLCMACILSNCYDTKKQHQYKNRATLVGNKNAGPLRSFAGALQHQNIISLYCMHWNLLGFLSYPIKVLGVH